MKTMTLAIAASAMALALAAPAFAASGIVHTETRLVHKPIPGPVVVDFRAFDLNGDGQLSRIEVGEKLFHTFDKNRNGLIDNIEFTTPMVMTLAPMERQTIQYVDYTGAGRSEPVVVAQEVFMQQTGLSRFDPSGKGLSASGFIGQPMKAVDRDRSGQIDMTEWKQAYDAIARPLPQNESFRYNR